MRLEFSLLIVLVCQIFADSPTEEPAVDENLIVNTKSGTVQGEYYDSLDDKRLGQFLGIPYAKAPVGDLRFAHPEPVEHWEGTRKSVEFGSSCLQFEKGVDDNGEAFTKVLDGSSEDCLFLNIWAPHPRPEHASVLVFIPGGDEFQDGSSSMIKYNGANLASEENIIVVSMNYRLGELGFLYLGVPEAPGNVGLLDQALALKWVHDNIASFGGDPEKISLGGESSGADSVGLHMLNPSIRKLFNQAIMLDGIPISPDLVKTQKEGLHITHQLAEKTGCMSATKESEKILSCLRGLDAVELMNVTITNEHNYEEFFGPVVDEEYIADKPKILLKAGAAGHDIKVVLGTSLNVGFWINAFFIDQEPDEHHYINTAEFRSLIELVLDQHSNMIWKGVMHRYTNWEDPECPGEIRKQAIDFTTDYYFICPMVQMADELTLYGNDVYMFQFNQKPSNPDVPEWAGYTNDENLNYIFGIAHPENNYTNIEHKFSHGVMDSLGSFIRTGDPNTKIVEWPKYNLRRKPFLNVKAHPDVGHFLRAEICAFWNMIYPQMKMTEKALNSNKDNW